MEAEREPGDDDVERYEQLRRRALTGEAGWRLGLALFQQRGAAAWARAWRSTTPAPPSRPPVEPLVGGDAVVGVLANMALACLGGR